MADCIKVCLCQFCRQIKKKDKRSKKKDKRILNKKRRKQKEFIKIFNYYYA